MAVGRPRSRLQPGRSEPSAGSRHKLWKLCFVGLFYVFVYLELESHTYFIFSGRLAEFEFVCFGESVLFGLIRWFFFSLMLWVRQSRRAVMRLYCLIIEKQVHK